MEIKVGIVQGGREIVLESEETAVAVESAFAKAVADDGLLSLTDERGRKAGNWNTHSGGEARCHGRGDARPVRTGAHSTR